MSDDPRIRSLARQEPENLPVADDRPHGDLDALKHGAATLLEAGNRIGAIALLWSAVAIDPVDLGAHRRLAAMLANAGDIDAAANEYARYIDFLLPIGEVGRATTELQYGANMLGGHAVLHEAAERIAAAVRSLVPMVPAISGPSLPAPRLLPRVPFRFCIHDDGSLHWMQLEGGTEELTPSAVRLIDRHDNVIETRKCIPIASGQKGHAPVPEGERPGVAWVVVGVSDDVVAALDARKPMPFRFEAKVGDDWLVATVADTACRLGRRPPKVVAS